MDKMKTFNIVESKVWCHGASETEGVLVKEVTEDYKIIRTYKEKIIESDRFYLEFSVKLNIPDGSIYGKSERYTDHAYIREAHLFSYGLSLSACKKQANDTVRRFCQKIAINDSTIEDVEKLVMEYGNMGLFKVKADEELIDMIQKDADTALENYFDKMGWIKE